MQDITVPDIGDFKDVEVIEIRVKPGDTVAVDDTIIVLESDKATLDVPAPVAGRIAAVMTAQGDRVSQGCVIVTIESSDATPIKSSNGPKPVAAVLPPTPAIAAVPATPVSQAPTVEPASTRDSANVSLPHASPSIRKFARELGADLGRVTGSGPKGRILKEDIQAFVKTRLARGDVQTGGIGGLNLLPWPQIDFAKFGPVERVALSRVRRISGPNLARNAAIIPHVTNFDEADITELEVLRKTLNKEDPDIRLTLLAFVIKAAVATLKAFPAFNASLDGEDVVLKRYYNIGFAVDTPDGLVVPVIKDADRKGILEIAGETARIAVEARAGKLKVADIQGATFTISSLGGIGGTGFTPIINAPEVAILGLTRAQMKPVWNGEAFLPRLIQPVSLSWDHRVVDGVGAARFLVYLGKLLADFRRIAL
ncbi:MAG: dihydrolipoyllysine-residue acetyltransferase [Rhizomicrobium sp.]